MLITVLSAVFTLPPISEICVIFIVLKVMIQMAREREREIICPRSHGEGLKLVFI